MINTIKDRIDKELNKFAANLDKLYSLNKISPLLTRNIQDFIVRPGKRTRPLLFILGYMGFSIKQPKGLYRSSLSAELLHDFMLIHDDIIDKSDMRRNLPSMHAMLNTYLANFKNIKFNGQDLAIVAGDVLYAIAIDTFLSIKENDNRKSKALKKFIEAAIYTGSGEFIELLYGAKDIEDITKEDIYKIYNYKTAYYTFACPLSIGAILAGASQKQIDLLSKCGLYLGNAFQIQDDLLGMFCEEKKIGKSGLVDLQESKKTILIWQAYHNSPPENKSVIRDILTKNNICQNDLIKMREIVTQTGAKTAAEKEIAALINKAFVLIKSSRMNQVSKQLLLTYSKNILGAE